ncbi:MAG: DUF1549 domain-containing protein [Planctomycetia bacterium]|nr:DUF1549 domain-containing protein [Planctomycetia bacterium]
MRCIRSFQVFVTAAVASLLIGSATLPAQTPNSASKGDRAKRAKAAASQVRRRDAIAQNEAPKTPAATVAQQSTPESAPASRTYREAVDPLTVAAQVDELIAAELNKAGVAIAPRCSDEDFLRRVSFDIAGVAPSPRDVTLFGLDPDSKKRAAVVDRLLAGSDYAKNWARYWHDVIAPRATETRPQFMLPALQAFESWMNSQIAANRPWDEIATALITALGDSKSDGQTALIISQRAEPDDIAAETSRLFLGIQLQCANCHDHPTDSWKREQFHSLAAFFPRIQMRPKGEPMMPRTQSLELVSFVPGQGNGRGRGDFIRQINQNPDQLIRRLDKNGDRKISRDEAKQAQGGQFERLFDLGDSDKDGFLTAAELKKLPPPPQNMQPGRGAPEYLMPDLQHPNSDGKQLDPVFFLGNLKAGSGMSDLDRRQSLARYITSPGNPWFAKAFVNRLWGQLVGEGFYMPIDDLGPERTARHPAALEALSKGFTSSGYDIAWLFRAITNTETYQRQTRPRDPNQSLPFASAAPSRLRADLLYDSLATVLGFKDQEPKPLEGDDMMAMYRRNATPRAQFHQLFGFDPSTPPDEINGTIPQALFMMNSPVINGLTRAGGQTRLHQVLDRFKDDDTALGELFVLVHSREPSEKELATCRDYIKQVNNRQEAFEDILWTLLNSTEFQTKR